MNLIRNNLYKLKIPMKACFGWGASNIKLMKAGTLVKVHEIHAAKEFYECITIGKRSGWIIIGFSEFSVCLAELDNYVGIWNEINT